MLKNLNLWQIFSALMVAASLYFFSYFQELVVLEIILVILALLALYWHINKMQSAPLGFLTIFLIVFSLYASHDSSKINLWQAILVFILISYGFNYQQFINIKNINGTIYASLLTVVMVEIFVTLAPWPTDALNRSFLLLAIYYFFFELLLSHLKNNLTTKKIIYLAVFIILITIAIISTLSWLGY